MKFNSTRNNKTSINIDEALIRGIDTDGGLFIPSCLPVFNNEQMKSMKSLDFPSFSAELLRPFFKGSKLENQILDICHEAFNFEVKLVKINKDLTIMELFHGPTLAFKDFGARFLASCLDRLGEKLTIVTATSGDTGSAVASAFHRKNNIKVKILYPKDGVSSRQKSQLNFLKDNIETNAVDGDFDLCQEIIKKSLALNRKGISSANSINIGRLLGQITYYAYSSLINHDSSYIIPTGNSGNSLSCFWARNMGFPIKNITLACNSNTAVSEFKSNNILKKCTVVKTIANAMDVGLPSNLERFKYYNYNGQFLINNTSDSEIEKTILKYKDYYISDPHTACALEAYKGEENTIVVSTADPSKFPEVYIKLGINLVVPERLKECIKASFHESVINEKDFIKKLLIKIY